MFGFFREFVGGAYKDIHFLIFKSKDFPFWITIQPLWACYVVHRSHLPLGSRSSFVAQLIPSVCIAVISRLICLLFSAPGTSGSGPAPSGIVSVLISASIYFSPYDIVYEVISVCYYFVGFAQGLGQVRFFLAILHNPNVSAAPLVAPVFAVLDLLIEAAFRLGMGAAATPMSNGPTALRTIALVLVFILLTRAWPVVPEELGQLILGFLVGVANAAAMLVRPVGQSRQPSPRPRRA
jgi:hypothetical protein